MLTEYVVEYTIDKSETRIVTCGVEDGYSTVNDFAKMICIRYGMKPDQTQRVRIVSYEKKTFDGSC